MSIVVRGLGVGGVDTGSTIVAFGVARDALAGETPAQVIMTSATDVDAWFVVDYGTGRRKPTEKERKRIQRMQKMLADGTIIFRENKKRHGFEYWLERAPKFRNAA